MHQRVVSVRREAHLERYLVLGVACSDRCAWVEGGLTMVSAWEAYAVPELMSLEKVAEDAEEGAENARTIAVGLLGDARVKVSAPLAKSKMKNARVDVAQREHKGEAGVAATIVGGAHFLSGVPAWVKAVSAPLGQQKPRHGVVEGVANRCAHAHAQQVARGGSGLHGAPAPEKRARVPQAKLGLVITQIPVASSGARSDAGGATASPGTRAAFNACAFDQARVGRRAIITVVVPSPLTLTGWDGNFAFQPVGGAQLVKPQMRARCSKRPQRARANSHSN
ncbi:MAG: hypothetical protein NZM37_09315 [Sandaracinaceae bacterium]|nr:hypothetical protein [Sandaracinaceae bacterium]